jgi:arginyl-tRNA synthetase
LRWAADLGLEPAEITDGLGGQLSSPAERALLGLLSFLPVRVAAAARRRRPDELPRYLEQVSAAWLVCRLQAPALPFGGMAAPRDADQAGARLVLVRAVAAVIAAGLALTGVAAPDRL